jgi:hypothetical protein
MSFTSIRAKHGSRRSILKSKLKGTHYFKHRAHFLWRTSAYGEIFPKIALVGWCYFSLVPVPTSVATLPLLSSSRCVLLTQGMHGTGPANSQSLKLQAYEAGSAALDVTQL